MNHENSANNGKPAWRAPTLVEFQDELSPQGGFQSDNVEDPPKYRPTS